MKALLAKQVMHKQLNRRLIALRTLSVAASDSDVRTDPQKTIQLVLNGIESQQRQRRCRNDAVANACMHMRAWQPSVSDLRSCCLVHIYAHPHASAQHTCQSA